MSQALAAVRTAHNVHRRGPDRRRGTGQRGGRERIEGAGARRADFVFIVVLQFGALIEPQLCLCVPSLRHSLVLGKGVDLL